MGDRSFACLGVATALIGIIGGCTARVTQLRPFRTSLLEYSWRMQRVAKAARQGNAESALSEFSVACEDLHSAEAIDPKSDAMRVSTMATQCSVVLAEFAMGNMKRAIAILEDLTGIDGFRRRPAGRLTDVDPHWKRCAFN